MEIIVFDRGANLFLAQSGRAPRVEFELNKGMTITVIAKADGRSAAAVPQMCIELADSRIAVAA